MPLDENNNACIYNLQVISTNFIYDTIFIGSIPFSDIKINFVVLSFIIMLQTQHNFHFREI